MDIDEGPNAGVVIYEHVFGNMNTAPGLWQAFAAIQEEESDYIRKHVVNDQPKPEKQRKGRSCNLPSRLGRSLLVGLYSSRFSTSRVCTARTASPSS
jgi:hypothetical protein